MINHRRRAAAKSNLNRAMLRWPNDLPLSPIYCTTHVATKLQCIMVLQELHLEARVAGDEDVLGIIWMKRITLLPAEPTEIAVVDSAA